MSMLQKMVLFCTMTTISVAVSAQVVQCVDANGKKIYSQTCPNNTTKQREIETPPAVTPSSSTQAAQKKMQSDEKEFEKRRTERLKSEAVNAEKDQKAARDSQACTDARSRLALLQSGRQSKRADPDSGEHVPMDEEQRQSEIDDLNSQISTSCK